MAMSDADKKESHRIACAKHYKKKQAALRRESKLRMRRLRALRKSGKAPPPAAANETDIAQASRPDASCSAPAEVGLEGDMDTRSCSPEPALEDNGLDALASEDGDTASVNMSILDDGADDGLAIQDGDSDVSVDESESHCSSMSESRERQEPQSLYDGLTWANAAAQKAKRTQEYLAEQTMLKDLDEWYKNDCIEQGRPVESDDDNESLPVASDSEDI